MKSRLSIIILSHNRREALARTLAHVSPAGAQVIVADNASADGSADAARSFAGVEVLEMGSNAGIAGFNRAAERASGEWLLILDDDARPDLTALAAACDLLVTERAITAVAMNPRHPLSLAYEWPFATPERLGLGLVRGWPVMGSANLVRATAWRAAGGYCERFYLYRNDTDLALTLLAMSMDVAFDPTWVVWHDSPAALSRRKSVRWHHLGTRNWVWMARRHAGGIRGARGIALGVASSARYAGLSPARVWATVRGAAEGLILPTPPTPEGMTRDAAAFDRLVNLKLRR